MNAESLLGSVRRKIRSIVVEMKGRLVFDNEHGPSYPACSGFYEYK